MPDFKKASAGSNTTGFSTMLDRRQLLLGAASAAVGAATLGVTSGLGMRTARAADRTEISFASASFFGTEGLGDLVKAYNESQDRIMVKAGVPCAHRGGCTSASWARISAWRRAFSSASAAAAPEARSSSGSSTRVES